MKSFKVFISILLIVSSFTLSVGNTFAQTETTTSTESLQTDQVLIEFKSEPTSEGYNLNELIKVNVPDERHLYSSKIPSTETVESYSEILLTDSNILTIEPDSLLSIQNSNDPYIREYQTHHKVIRTDEAWSRTKGSTEVKVAVLDNGFDTQHLDLVNQIEAFETTTSKFNNELHGTHVAGLIAASNNNGIFGSGVAPNTKLVLIDVFENEQAYTSDVIEGIYLASEYEVDVMNLSFGTYTYSEELNKAVQFVASKGTVLVAPSGNDSTDAPMYPASFENVLSVGSVDDGYYMSSFSNFGSKLDLVAPGRSVWSTSPDNDFVELTGTSMSAAIVSGVAALVKSNEPSLNKSQIEQKLFKASLDMGYEGYDEFFGHGLILASEAVNIFRVGNPKFGPLNEFTKVIKGNWPYDFEQPTTIYITDGDAKVYAEYPNFYGQDFEIPVNLMGLSYIYFHLVDSYGTEYGRHYVPVQDMTAPAKPIVSPVGDNDKFVKVKTEREVVITIRNETEQIAGYYTFSNQEVSVPISKQKAGTTLYITATDAANRQSEATEIVVSDNTLPTFTELEKIYQSSPQVTGKTEPLANVKLSKGTEVLGTVIANEEGRFAIDLPIQKVDTELTLRATDVAGNIGNEFAFLVFDSSPPPLPEITKVTEFTTYISGQFKNLTSSKYPYTVILSTKDGEVNRKEIYSRFPYVDFEIGRQQPGTEYFLKVVNYNGFESETLSIIVEDVPSPSTPVVYPVTNKEKVISGITSEGTAIIIMKESEIIATTYSDYAQTFYIQLEDIQAGDELLVYAEDSFGQLSEPVELIVQDTVAPQITSVEEVTDQSTEVTGKTEPFSKLTITKNDKLLGIVYANEDGYFEMPMEKQKGDTEIQIIASDEVGNLSEAYKIIVKDLTAPEKPILQQIVEGDYMIKGYTEPGIAIDMYINGEFYQRSYSFSETGEFNFYLFHTYVGKDSKLSFKSIDNQGNESEWTVVYPVDLIPPSAPIVQPVTNIATVVKGTTEGFAAVEVYNGVFISSGEADQYGNFEITIPVQEQETILEVVAIDSSGNRSETTSVYVRDVIPPPAPQVNMYAENEEYLTGEAELFSRVEVYHGVKLVASKDLNYSSVFEVALYPYPYLTELTVYAVDASGNRSEPTTIIVQDITPPVLYVNPYFYDSSTVITGHSDPFSIVTVMNENYSMIGSVETDEMGGYSITIPKQEAHSTLRIVARDSAGNTTFETLTVLDNTPPAKPLVDVVTDASYEITGSAEPFSTVYAMLFGSFIGEALADENGIFKITLKNPPVSDYPLYVFAVDTSNNEGDMQQVLVQDVTVPFYRMWGPVTNEDTLIGGFTEPFTSVELYSNGELEASGISDASGYFAISINKPDYGKLFTLYLTDASGNRSEGYLLEVIDNRVPYLMEMEQITNASNQIKGRTEPDSMVKIVVNDTTTIADVVSDGEGYFEVPIDPLEAGTLIKLIIEDRAGNQYDTGNFMVDDKIPPAAANVDLFHETSTEVSGTAEKNSTIRIYSSGGYYAVGTTNSEGYFKIRTRSFPADTELTIIVSDDAGNNSEPVVVVVKDITPPSLITLDEISKDSKKISGQTEANSTVTMYNNSKLVAQAVAEDDGKFVLNFNQINFPGNVVISIIDSAGNRSIDYKYTVAYELYKDVALTHWGIEEIMYLKDYGIISGYDDNSFKPSRHTTRAEAAKMLVVALGLPLPKAESGFKDVKANHWASDYISAAKKAGIFGGNPDGTFNPNGKLTRAEMAKVLSVAYKLESKEPVKFTDVKATHWASPYIAGLYENSITTGYDNGTFLPNKSITRAEFSALLARTLNEDFR